GGADPEASTDDRAQLRGRMPRKAEECEAGRRHPHPSAIWIQPCPGLSIVQGASAIRLQSVVPQAVDSTTPWPSIETKCEWLLASSTVTTVLQRLTPTSSAPPWQSVMSRWSRSPLTRIGTPSTFTHSCEAFISMRPACWHEHCADRRPTIAMLSPSRN